MLQSEVLKRINEPKNGNAISRGVIHGQRLRFHNDVTLTYADTLATYLSTFKAWVASILPADKYDRFLSLMTFPIATNELTETIYKNLSRVFEGENRIMKATFKDKAESEEFAGYFNHEKFQKAAFRAIQSNIDTIVVCDAPSEQEGELSEPYYNFVDISQVIDIDICDNEIELIIFKNEGKIIAMDSEFIRVFDKDHRMTAETINTLGYTPARMLWGDLLRTDTEINRKSPLTSVLSKLDKLLFDLVSRDYAELYGKYPILVAYEIQKDYSTGKDDAENNGKGNRLFGPGTIIETPPPGSKDEVDLNANAVRFINVDENVLKFIDDRIRADADDIFRSVVGTGGDPVNDQAKNEKQIQAGFESKQDVINSLKKNFEEIHKWTLETIARMQYGDKFMGCEIDYGTEFYLISPNEILKSIGDARALNVPDTVVMDMTRRYFNSKYKTDADSRKRADVIRDIDPFPSNTSLEIFEIYKASPEIIGTEKMYLKVHFEELINRFERENVSLENFGKPYEYYKKIEIIKTQILVYVNEAINTSQQGQRISDTVE